MVLVAEVNLVGVLVAAIASMVLGMIWYGPLFGKKWMELTGKKMSEMGNQKEMPKTYLLGFLGALVTAYILGGFLQYAQAATVVEGVLVGIMAWLGFVATVTLGAVLWDQKPWSLYFLLNGYHLVNFALMGAILMALG